jgi:transposase-like protein
MEYTTVSKCPECGSENIQVIDIIEEYGTTDVRHVCWDCDYDWHEYEEEPEEEDEDILED